MNHYILIGTFKGTPNQFPEFSAAMEAHHAYLKSYKEKGMLLLSGPNRTKLILSFKKRKKQAIKTLENIEQIIEYLRNVGEANTATIPEKIGLSTARTRDIHANMDEVEALGSNRNRTYRLKTDI